MFNVDFKRIRELMLPPRLRKVIWLAWTRVTVFPIQQLHALFLTFRENTIFDVGFTNQIIYLEYLLNLRFDPTGNSVFIDNVIDGATGLIIHRKVELVDPLIVYRKSEGQPPVILKRKSESGPFDFIVFISAAVTFNEPEMKRTINFYRLAGKRFDIQTY